MIEETRDCRRPRGGLARVVLDRFGESSRRVVFHKVASLPFGRGGDVRFVNARRKSSRRAAGRGPTAAGLPRWWVVAGRVMPSGLPVPVLTERSAVSSDSAATAGLQSGSTAVPTALKIMRLQWRPAPSRGNSRGNNTHGSRGGLQVRVFLVLDGRRHRGRSSGRRRDRPRVALRGSRVPVDSQERSLPNRRVSPLRQRKIEQSMDPEALVRSGLGHRRRHGPLDFDHRGPLHFQHGFLCNGRDREPKVSREEKRTRNDSTDQPFFSPPRPYLRWP